MKHIKVHKRIKLGYENGMRAYKYVRTLKGTSATDKYSAVKIGDSDIKHEARKLHASIYLKKGFIDAYEVNEDGVIHDNYDPYHKTARYFVVTKGVSPSIEVVSTARQIVVAEGQGYSFLPVYANAKLHDKARDLIHEIPPKKIVEISALVKNPGSSTQAVLALYKEMLRHSYNEGDELWLMACSPSLYKRLKFLFTDSIELIGDQTEYKGEDIVPAALRIKPSVARFRQSTFHINPIRNTLNKQLREYLLEGLNVVD